MHTAGHTHAVYTAHVNTDGIYTHMTHTLKGINQTLTQEVICKALGRGELYIFTFMWQEALLNINVNGLGREMSLSLFCFCVAFFTIYDHMALLLFDIHQLTHIFPSTNPLAWTCKTWGILLQFPDVLFGLLRYFHPSNLSIPDWNQMVDIYTARSLLHFWTEQCWFLLFIFWPCSYGHTFNIIPFNPPAISSFYL